MTCAAVGAIYYGWSALTDQEKDEIIEKLSKGLEIGIEMIKSVIRFVIDKTKELWNSENLSEIKGYISNAAKVFGKTLADVTHILSDKIFGGLSAIKTKTMESFDKTTEFGSQAIDVIKEKGEQILDRNGDGKITLDDFKPWSGQNKSEDKLS